jgi:hypothetical protein
MGKHGVNHQKEIIKLIKQASYSRSTYQVFNDWLEMSAISISNSMDFTHREEREARYLDLINAYEPRHQQLFHQMLGHLIEALHEKTETTGPEDVLGPIFHELELHNKYKGQFFTPQAVSDMMAQMVCGSETQDAIAEQGFINVCEPSCGSGVMITSFLKSMQAENLNYCTQLVVTAVDVDLKCVHMAYLQLALYGIPAVVIHGNSLTCDEFSRWYTPVYLLNGWIWRFRCCITTKFCPEDEMIKCALEPSYAAMRKMEALIAGTTNSEPNSPSETDSIDDAEPVSLEQMSFDVDFDVFRTQEPLPMRTTRVRKSRAKKSVTDNQISLFEGCDYGEAI